MAHTNVGPALLSGAPSQPSQHLIEQHCSDASKRLSPLPSLRSRIEESHDENFQEARLTFNKTIAGNYRRARTGYEKIGVLCITWADDDMQCKGNEVDRLRGIFERSFGYETELFEIPSKRCRTALKCKLSNFCYRYDNPDYLMIVYYGGHGYQGEETKKFKLSAKAKPDGDGDPNAFFDDVLDCLRVPNCDQLVILDCCHASRAYTRDFIGGKRKFEWLTSAAADEKCDAPTLPGSFTHNLNQCLAELLQSSPGGFSTSELFNRIYHEATGVKPHHFEQSRHNYGKIVLRPRAVIDDTRSAEDATACLTLTLQLNKEPLPFVINELASSLSFLPHVDQIMLDDLYAPKQQLSNFVQAASIVTRLLPLIRRLREKRLKRGQTAMKGMEGDIPRTSRLEQMLLRQNHKLSFDCEGSRIQARQSGRSQTWPSAKIINAPEMKGLDLSRKLGEFWPENLPDNDFPRRRAYTSDFLWQNQSVKVRMDFSLLSLHRRLELAV